MIDMDELVGDDDFFQPMTVWRRQITYDSNGSEVLVPTLISPAPLGSIQSGANPEMLRQANLTTVEDLITIYTAFRLYREGDFTSATGPLPVGPVATDSYGNAILPDDLERFKSDTVVFQGDVYQVFLVQDWTTYGAGFVEALARKVNRGQVAQ
ncbi:hypothetical protein [Novosphingobium sp.]|uniref:hypothetical protein n=1 Tax=Novosphingobium sp. TaxID=1874826 RepID=UPI002634FB10|nr:hypothetical protein [Novosphingobium sp.]